MKESHELRGVLVASIACMSIACSDSPTTAPAAVTPIVELGSMTIVVSTATDDGGQVDPDGYSILIDGQPARSLSPNDTLVITGIPVRDYTVTLSGLTLNCRFVSAGTQTARVTASLAASIAFDVICGAFPEFAAVTYGDQGLAIVLAGIGGITRLTDDSDRPADPAWSPDGKRIAFSSWRENYSDIYVMDADGRNKVRLTDDPANDYHPTWSPDGTTIAFTSERDMAQRAAIYTMNADGTNQSRITGLGAVDRDPAWAPDGRTIAFASDRGSAHGIWLVNPDGSGGRQLTFSPRPDLAPAWAPDGRIAFTRTDPATNRRTIVVVEGDGSRAVNVTPTHFNAETPSWSPDGSRIAFTASGDPNTQECGWYACDLLIEVIGTDGRSHQSPITVPAFQAVWRPKATGR